MNHTIKGILIVAAITSMLVVGATMIPIMQNSFASKKSDFKKPERDTNTNSNTNTNTMPFLNVVAQRDELVASRSSTALNHAVGSVDKSTAII